MKLAYKLVRDNIPDLIFNSGRTCTFNELKLNDELLACLSNKLLEEACEVKTAISNMSKEEIVEELADVYEVLDCIETNCNINHSYVTATQALKKVEKGSFSKGIFLREID